MEILKNLKKVVPQKFQKANEEQHAHLEQMATGLFQAEPPDHKDEALVEVTKLRLAGPLTALQLHELDKSFPEDVPWEARPSRGIVVDCLPGIVYYYFVLQMIVA